MISFFSPVIFASIARAAVPFLWAAALVLIGLGAWQGLVASPVDYQQGDFVRIMYVHVPAAWMAMGIYAAMAIASLGTLVWKHPLADIAARNSAPIGAIFCALCLITGMIWARPMWGAWWVWDARLTSMLVLMFLYLGYMMLARSFDQAERATLPLAVLALVGAINLPVIKFSVEWWNTLHQPASVFRAEGSSIHPDMLRPLMLMALGFGCFYVANLLMAIQTELWERKYWREMMRRQRSQ